MNDETLFHQAQAKSAGERAALLDQACGDDAGLRQRIESLLHAHDNPGNFMAEPVVDPASPQNLEARHRADAFLADPTAAAAPATVPVGEIIGRYKLLQLIGEGGFGTVYMAEQQHPVRRRVALKIIKLGMDTKQVIARFEAERQALAMMDHPNIAKVLDAGATDAGRPYFVMELVRGVPITDYCDTNNLPVPERLNLFVQVCRAVQHAHQKGIIHRDIKPSNVMVAMAEGHPVPKVIDFGIAKATNQQLTEKTIFTEFRQMIGTPQYMSPEQAEMAGIDIDTRSDVYSLGVLLYELLVGSTPFDPKELRSMAYGEMQRMIREVEPQRPSTRLSTLLETLPTVAAHRRIEPRKLGQILKGELDWIVMRAMEKDRTRRYESANSLAQDLERYLANEAVAACPPSAKYRFGKFARKHRASLRTALAVLILLLATTAFSAWQAIGATKAGNLAEARLQEATEARRQMASQLDRTRTAERQVRSLLFDSRLSQAKASHLSRCSGQRLDSLDTIVEATQIARDLTLSQDSILELRNVALACLVLPDVRLGRQWYGWPVGSDHADFDGNLDHYARVDKKGSVSIRNVADDLEIARLPGSGSETYPRFSADGRFLAVWSVELNVWKLGGAEPSVLIHRPAGDFGGIDFSPDANECAIGHEDGSISLYELRSGAEVRRLPKGSRAAYLAYSPGGRSIAVATDDSVEIRDLGSGVVSAVLPIQASVACLAWSPDGFTLAVAANNQRIYLWNVTGGTDAMVLEGTGNNGIGVAFNHAGNLLASTGLDHVLRLWDPRTGKQIFNTPSAFPCAIPRFSRDDRQLAGNFHAGNIHGSRMGIWDVTVGDGEYRTLVSKPSGGSQFYKWSATDHEGRLLAVAMQDGVRLWDLKKSAEVGLIQLKNCDQVLVDASGDLLTNGSSGVLRWPIRWDAGGLVRFGPPTHLAFPGPICHIASSANGQVIAVSQFDGGRVLHLDRADSPIRLQPHDDAHYVAVSANGRWVATGSLTGSQVKVWDASNGKLVKELPADGSAVEFSNDDKWLATTSGGLHLWSAESWELAREIGGGDFAFSPDSRMVAVETGSGVVRLVDPATGREYARLEDPSQHRASCLRFTSDGTQLIATGHDAIHVWDLRKLRKSLFKLGLDWELPSYEPERADDSPLLRVDIRTGTSTLSTKG